MQTHLKSFRLLSAIIASLALITIGRAATPTFTVLHDFALPKLNTTTGHEANTDGSSPWSSLLLNNGVLYGTTYDGGPAASGTIFKLNANGTGFMVLHNFSAVNIPALGTNSDGASPRSSLIISGTTLFGTTALGGVAGKGAVFSLDGTAGGNFKVLYSFTNGDDGGYPSGGLVLSGNTLYGSTTIGGNSGVGVVFSINTNGSGFAILAPAGSSGSLLLSGGVLYGTTQLGGTNEDGSVFSLNTDGSGFTSFYSFSESDGGTNMDGGSPVGGLVMSGNTLFGACTSGGSAAFGTLFSVHTDGSGFLTLHSFSPLKSSQYLFTNTDGALPLAGLFLSGTTLYGTTSSAGPGDIGTVFSLSTDGTGFETLHGFGTITYTHGIPVISPLQGAQPFGGLVMSGSTLYGTTSSGGTGVAGTVFSLNLAGGVAPPPPVGKPTLTITPPKTGTTVSNALLTVTGIAGDPVSLQGVYYQLNGGVWNLATESASWSNWTASVTLTPGVNVISAYSTDADGVNSKTNSISIKFILSAPLTVQTNGIGSITPVENGKLLAIGTSYTLTAAAGKNWLFSNWVASGSQSFVSNNPALKFTMQSNLTLTANFVTNLFLAAQGTYHGLFAPAIAPRQQNNSGAFALTITSAGLLTGDLFIGAQKIPLSGKFGLDGSATIAPTSKYPLTTTLQLNLANQSVQGTVTGGSFLATLMGDQAVFSGTHKATSYQGPYTFIIPGGTDPTVGPFGTSYGTVTVGPTGTILYSVYLADGTSVFSQSSFISKDGFWPFYVPLYGGAGSIWGWNGFTNQAIASAPVLSWINPTNSTKTAVYRGGFTNQQATLTGSSFTMTDKPLLSLSGGQVILDEASWASPITNLVNLAQNNTITIPPSGENTNGLALKITPASGLISGTFLNPTNSKLKITLNGVLLQNQTNAQGYFLGAGQSGSFTLQAQ